ASGVRDRRVSCRGPTMRSRRPRIVCSRPPRAALSESSPMERDHQRFEFGILDTLSDSLAVGGHFNERRRCGSPYWLICATTSPVRRNRLPVQVGARNQRLICSFGALRPDRARRVEGIEPGGPVRVSADRAALSTTNHQPPTHLILDAYIYYLIYNRACQNQSPTRSCPSRATGSTFSSA